MLKLGKPDYSGVWKSDRRPYSSSFDMYILNRKRTGFLKPEEIDGIIIDSTVMKGETGLAVFRGETTGIDIRFIKSYPQKIDELGNIVGFYSLLYEGAIDENGNVKGWYQYVRPHTPSHEQEEKPKFDFVMRRVKRHISLVK